MATLWVNAAIWAVMATLWFNAAIGSMMATLWVTVTFWFDLPHQATFALAPTLAIHLRGGHNTPYFPSVKIPP